MRFVLLSVIAVLLGVWTTGCGGSDPARPVDSPPEDPPDEPSLLLYSSMESPEEILRPSFATATYDSLDEAIPGIEHITFEAGRAGRAARIDANGFQYSWPVDGPLRFHGDNFDFADPDNDGGRLDFWIKFNVDPHTIYENTWLARSNWGQRYINYEFAGSNGNPTDLFVFVYSDIPNNERTNYGGFGVTPRGWNRYEGIRQGEWHLFTLTWRRNGGPHRAELHLYIDGTQEGCLTCNDYNGNLPPDGSITDFFFSPQLYDHYIPFSVDEVYSFASWDVSNLQGNFADLQIPEGVTLTYPMDSRSPIWGSPVTDPNLVYEFFVINDEADTCSCDLLVDGAYAGSVLAESGILMEIAGSAPLAEGTHTFQVTCDEGRLVSDVTQFVVDLP